MSIDTSSLPPCSRASRRKSPADISASPRARRWAFKAVRRNWTLETPGISTGYWKPRNRPAAARSSGRQFEEIAPRRR
jgi:hypothetical protein